MDDKKIINNSVEFVNFVKENPNLESSLQEQVQVWWNNIIKMRATLDRKPCGCGGVNPEIVIAQRKENLENFYAETFSNEEFLEKIKELIPVNTILKSRDKILLEL